MLLLMTITTVQSQLPELQYFSDDLKKGDEFAWDITEKTESSEPVTDQLINQDSRITIKVKKNLDDTFIGWLEQLGYGGTFDINIDGEDVSNLPINTILRFIYPNTIFSFSDNEINLFDRIVSDPSYFELYFGISIPVETAYITEGIFHVEGATEIEEFEIEYEYDTGVLNSYHVKLSNNEEKIERDMDFGSGISLNSTMGLVFLGIIIIASIIGGKKYNQYRKEQKSTKKKTEKVLQSPKYCPNCGSENQNTTFCRECGNKIA